MTPAASAALAALFMFLLAGWFVTCERLRAEREKNRRTK